jgi:hypothetical protein
VRGDTRRATAIRAGVVTVCAGVAVGVWILRPDGGAAVRVVAQAPVERAVAAPLPIIGAARSSPAVVSRVAPPVRLRVPAIGVDTGLQPLGLEQDGTLQTPAAWGVAGWYAGGPRPGEPGPAVIVGHIDSTSGPAVFFRLREIHVGSAVLVTQRGGAVLRFVVDDVAMFAKARFPTGLVYGPQPLPVLRLITCTGAFDFAAGSYLDNLVVSAHLASG